MKLMKKGAGAALLLVVAACGGGDGGGIARPDELDLRIVRGDGQRARVVSTASASAARLSVAGQTDPDVLPEPLVARIVIDGGPSASRGGAGEITGPTMQTLPAGILVDWSAEPEGCGRPFVNSTPPVADTVTNFWRKGTRAGVCKMRLRLIAGGQPVTVDSFTATFDPGPIAPGYTWNRAGFVSPIIVSENVLHDVHDNIIPYRVVLPAGDTVLTVGGDEAGTEPARTLSYDKEKVVAWVNSAECEDATCLNARWQIYTLDLEGRDGQVLARIHLRINHLGSWSYELQRL